MQEYTIEITEVLQKQIKVKSVSSLEAMREIKQFYKNGLIILNSENFIDAEFKIVKGDDSY